MSARFAGFASLAATIAWLDLPVARGQSAPVLECTEIAALEFRDMKFNRSAGLTAELVAAGEDVPAHCNITGRLWPEIDFAVKLPTEWNGRFVMTGNGGAGGGLRTQALDPLVAQGYTAAADDTGHEGRGDDFSFAYNPQDDSNPNAAQKLEDLAYRSIHETANLTKKIIAAYYGEEAVYSYYYGASQGGRQGLKNAQLYPDDFDGWSIGYPVLDITRTTMQGMWNLRATLLAPEEVTPAKMPALSDAVMAQCDAADGLADELISNPTSCDFDPTRHLPSCAPEAETASCFTPSQIAALEKVYRGPVSSDGEELFYPTPLGSEQMAPARAFPGAPPPPAPVASLWDGGTVVGWRNGDIMSARSGGLGSTFVKYVVYQDPDFDWRSDFYDEYRATAAEVAEIIDATDPDLADIAAAGKKIVHYHGLSDALVTPYQSVGYYEAVRQALGEAETAEFYKFYIIPGMGHGPFLSIGPSFVEQDWLDTLREWVENDVEPHAIIAARPANEAAGLSAMTRPLCPYPLVAVYNGDGDIRDAANFSCGAPPIPG